VTGDTYAEEISELKSVWQHTGDIYAEEISELKSVWQHTGNTYSYSASHSRVAPENVALQKERKYNTFACHTCNEVRLCVLGIRNKEVGNKKR
jgi:hypothetical protein